MVHLIAKVSNALFSAHFVTSSFANQENHFIEELEKGHVQQNIQKRGELDPEQVVKAGADELGWIHRQKVYAKVPLEECYQNTGHPPITLNWVDRNNGDEQRPNYRSRLVVREVKKSSRTDMLPEHESFSAMPPLEALKLLCSIMVSTKTSKAGKSLKLKLYDISRAHIYGESRRKVYTNLPEGDESPGHCALLLWLKTMYGAQDASSVWQETYTELIEQNGITHGLMAMLGQLCFVRNLVTSSCWCMEMTSCAELSFRSSRSEV